MTVISVIDKIKKDLAQETSYEVNAKLLKLKLRLFISSEEDYFNKLNKNLENNVEKFLLDPSKTSYGISGIVSSYGKSYNDVVSKLSSQISESKALYYHLFQENYVSISNWGEVENNLNIMFSKAIFSSEKLNEIIDSIK